MLRGMTNPKQKRAFCLSHSSSAARSHDLSSWLCVPAIWIPPRRQKPITHSKQSDVISCWVIIWQVTDKLLHFKISSLRLWERECVPLCPVFAGRPESAVCPWEWPRPAPECPGCDVGGHGRKNCPSNCEVLPWRPAALHPVKNSPLILKKNWKKNRNHFELWTFTDIIG